MMTWLLDMYNSLKSSIYCSEIVLYLVIFIGTWFVYKISLKPFLSPLRKIPGCPYIPFVGNMINVRRSEAMTNCIRWMEKYNSKIIRFYFYGGEERLLVADPDIVKQVLVTNSKNYVRYRQAVKLANLIGSPPLFSISGDLHHSIRKISNPAFSPNVLYGMIPVFEERVGVLSQQWAEQINTSSECFAEINIQQDLMRLTLDVICQVGFDYELHALETPDSAGEMNIKSLIDNIIPGLFDFLPFSDWIPTKSNKKMWRDAAFNKDFTEKLIQARFDKSQFKDSDKKQKDILSMLINARDEEGAGLTDKQLIGQVFGFLVAGFETTNITLTWILLKLAENQGVQEKVREEIITILGEAEQRITPESLDKMKYMACVIKETLRLLPPVTCVFKRAVADDNFKGYHIPKGTVVGLHIGALHRLNWEDGDQFKPDRFLNAEGVEGRTFVPFGFGPYMCIGNKFSMLEMKTILSVLVQKFQFDVIPDRSYRRVQGVTMRPHPAAVLRTRKV